MSVYLLLLHIKLVYQVIQLKPLREIFPDFIFWLHKCTNPVCLIKLSTQPYNLCKFFTFWPAEFFCFVLFYFYILCQNPQPITFCEFFKTRIFLVNSIKPINSGADCFLTIISRWGSWFDPDLFDPDWVTVMCFCYHGLFRYTLGQKQRRMSCLVSWCLSY